MELVRSLRQSLWAHFHLTNEKQSAPHVVYTPGSFLTRELQFDRISNDFPHCGIDDTDLYRLFAFLLKMSKYS